MDVTIGELLRRSRRGHGLSQARLARRLGVHRALISRVERGIISPSFAWVERALAAVGGELSVAVVRCRVDDHDPGAHRIVGAMSPDQRLDDFLASAGTLDALARAGAKPGRGAP